MTLVPGDDEEQDPTVLLWLYYFTAQHMLFGNRLGEALASVNKAIEHTPTLLELYTLKAKIYQKGGDRQHAAKLFEEARNLDKADRAINAISAMHTLKAGRVEEGTKIMDIFVKDCGYDVSIHDNQTMWFEEMSGRACLGNGDYQKALKNLKYC
jgi:Flp pilus assembly protein TadD